MRSTPWTPSFYPQLAQLPPLQAEQPPPEDKEASWPRGSAPPSLLRHLDINLWV